MGGKHLKFNKNPKWLHKRSEGVTKRGEIRQLRLMMGKNWGIRPHSVGGCKEYLGMKIK